MPLRGASPPPEVPSLLQMAQGVAPGGGGGGGVDLSMLGDLGRGGGAFQSDPMLNGGAPYRQITSPEDQNYSDLQGRPIHMGGPPPKYNPGTAYGGYNAIFDERAPTDGGWFTMADYLAQGPTPMEAAGWGSQSSGDGRGGGSNAPSSGGMPSPQMHPRVSQFGSTNVNNNALSTNNWRLLPEGFRDPNNFMINGTVVNRANARKELAPKSVLGVENGGFPGYYNQGTGQWATPVSSYGWRQGYIGSDPSGWAQTATPTY